MEDNINDIAKRMTRNEFLEEAKEPCMGNIFKSESCPELHGLNSFANTEKCSPYENCKECWKESVKDIKFKGEEETIAAICIDPGDNFHLTEGKTYMVKQSKEFTNFYELINDKGLKDSYLKSRFRILEGEKVEDKIIILEADNKEYRKENEELKVAIQEGIKSVKECGGALDNKNKRIIELEKEVIEYKEIRDYLNSVNRCLEEENKSYEKRIEELERILKTRNEEYTELKKQNNQGYMEQMNITLNEKNTIIENVKNVAKERLLRSEEAEKERDKAVKENRILIDKVEALKESVISLTELI